MAKSSSVPASPFGWDFQSNAAIVLMIKNIEKAVEVKVEGPKQDIEIKLADGGILYSQAKSVFNVEDNTNVIAKLKEALKTLNDTAQEQNVDSLIYVTNSPNPFNSVRTMYAFSASLNPLKYDELPDICKNKVEDICKKNNYNFDMSLFSIYVLQFQREESIRYKAVKDIINEFLYKIKVGDKGYGQQMLEIWQREFLLNLSQEKVTISKKQMIWPIIVLLCDINRDDSLLAGIGDSELDEIKNKYKDVINNNAERFSFITKVITSYTEYKNYSTSGDVDKLFVADHWTDFKSEINLPNASSEIIESVIKLSMANVIRSRYRISDIQKAVNL